MASLSERIASARKMTITVGHMTFHATRPTIEEFAALHRDKVKDPDIARRYITGWDNVLESDLLPGGSSDPVAFDPALWNEAIADMPKVWSAICAQIAAAAESFLASAGSNEKNSAAG